MTTAEQRGRLNAMRESDLTVVHVLAPAAVGGLETVVLSLVQGLAARGHRMVAAPVIDTDPQGHPFIVAAARGGLETHPLVLSGRNYFEERRAVRSLLAETGAQILHTHGYRADVVNRSVAAKEGIATASTAHGFTRNGRKNRFYERLQRRAFRRFDAVAAVSAELANELVRSGVSPDRVHTIRNPMIRAEPLLPRDEARRLLGLEPRRIVIGWIGRLTPEKDAENALRALATVEEEAPALSILGAGWQEAELRELARSLGLEDRVRWHGVVPAAGRVLSAFDVFVLSSRTEGTPMVLLEAVRAGVPIVATTVGGIPEILPPSDTILVPPADPTALGRGIQAALSDLRGARERTVRARSRLEQELDLEPWLDRYEEVYRTMLR